MTHFLFAAGLTLFFSFVFSVLLLFLFSGGIAIIDQSWRRGLLLLLTKQLLFPMLVSLFLYAVNLPRELVYAGFIISMVPPAQILVVFATRYVCCVRVLFAFSSNLVCESCAVMLISVYAQI